MAPRRRQRDPCDCGAAVVHASRTSRWCLYRHTRMPVRTAPAGDSSIAAEIARGPGREGTTALPPPPSQAVVAVAVSDPRTPVGVTPTGDSVVTAVIARGPGREGTAASLPAPQAAFAVATPDQTGMESNRPNLDATAIPGAAPNRRRCRACNGTDHVRSYSKRCSANRQQLLRAALDQGAPPMRTPYLLLMPAPSSMVGVTCPPWTSSVAIARHRCGVTKPLRPPPSATPISSCAAQRVRLRSRHYPPYHSSWPTTWTEDTTIILYSCVTSAR